MLETHTSGLRLDARLVLSTPDGGISLRRLRPHGHAMMQELGQDGVHVRQTFEQFIGGQRAELRRRDDVTTGVAQELQRGRADFVHSTRRNQDLPGHGGGV